MSETMMKGHVEGASSAPSAPAAGLASGRATAVQSPTGAAAWWQQHDERVYRCVRLWVEQWYPPQRNALTEAIGEVFGELRASVREAITNLKERVVRLETTSNFEERFTKLANEAKGGSAIQQSELLVRIEGLQRQLDELRRVAAQPGPQGPPGPPGKLPRVKEYVAECVHYEGEVVIHVGALWQARGDTVHAPPHADWRCLARAGRDAVTPEVRGTFDAHETYKKLDIVVSDGAAFIATHDDPGLCPGDGWQLLSRQGKPGRRGEKGEMGPRGPRGERGEASLTIIGWKIDPTNYRAVPFLADGTAGPELNLRPLFEAYLEETSA